MRGRRQPGRLGLHTSTRPRTGTGPRTLTGPAPAPAHRNAQLTIPPLTSVMLESVPHERAGLASGVLSAARQFGGAIGVALLGALIAASSLAAPVALIRHHAPTTYGTAPA